MRARYLAATVVLTTLALAACGGGGGGGTAPAPPITVTTPAPVTAPQSSATFPMTFSIPRKPSGTARSPRFFSPNAAAIAIYDGTTLLYVANLALDNTPPFTTVFAKSGATTVTFGTCSFTNATATCGFTVTTTIGAHTFDVIVYPASQGPSSSPGPQAVGRTPSDTGTPPTFHGVISSEGEIAVNLSPGTNPAQTMTLLGVADQVLFAGLTEGAYQSVTTFGYRIQDSSSTQIVQPGNAYDNGPVTITAAPAGIVTIAPNSIATPPATVGDQNFTVTCVNAAGGAATISFNTRTTPNTAYASGLTYSTGNYSGSTIQTIPFTCDAATATIPITVQGKKRT